MNVADAIETLKRARVELQAVGVAHLSLFGSMARGDARSDSDIDVAAALHPDVSFGAFKLVRLERRLAEMLGTRVDLVTEPSDRPRLQAEIDRDRVVVF
ncbi:putative nucleotidyltransferase [Sphingomonas sp. BE138]|uniref:nucleotidyltransferase family protein n=1 Tax=Sphingomonas sp. BE138 TaxID=2817845 RepID=UPI002857DE89|nr:nucleotidyltransferase domain-containing protein [Sphingomonas sp. BE138]MDR6788585.1 putative nucleotidyltransferase [Sphingomonas sp. BE138]